MRRYILVWTLRNRLYDRLRKGAIHGARSATGAIYDTFELEVLVDAMERAADPDWTVLFEGPMMHEDSIKAAEMGQLTADFLKVTEYRDPKNYFYSRCSCIRW